VSLQGQLSSWPEFLKTEGIQRKTCLYVKLLKWRILCCESETCLRTVRGYLVSELPDSADRGHPSEPSMQKWSGYTSIRPLSHQRNVTSYFRNWNVNSFKLTLFSDNSNYRIDFRLWPYTDWHRAANSFHLSCMLSTWCYQASLRSIHWTAYVTLPKHAQCGSWLCDVQSNSVAIVTTHSHSAGGVQRLLFLHNLRRSFTFVWLQIKVGGTWLWGNTSTLWNCEPLRGTGCRLKVGELGGRLERTFKFGGKGYELLKFLVCWLTTRRVCMYLKLS
jgi:hypothetical protein